MNKNYLLIVLALLSLSVNAGWFDKKEVKQAKNTRLDSCPNLTLEQMVSGYFSGSDWGYKKSGDKKLINIRGHIPFKGKKVNALIQYEVTDKSDLKLAHFELNQIPQDAFMIKELMFKMCAAASAKYQPQARSIEAGKIKATVYLVVPIEQNKIAITTDKGRFIIDDVLLSKYKRTLLTKAAENNSTLCFSGTDPIYKEGLTSQCAEID